MKTNDQVILFSFSLEDLEKTIRGVLIQTLTEMQVGKQANASDTEFMTVKEVSRLLNVSEFSIHKWKKDGKLKVYYFGSRVRFKKSDVLQLDKYKEKK